MKHYEEVVRAFVKPLATFIGKPVVEADTIGTRPPLPFVTYKVLAPRIVLDGYESGHEVIVIDGDAVKEQRITDIEMTFSINCYAPDSFSAFQTAGKAEEYLTFNGEQELQQRGLVVVEITNPQDRTLYLGDAYEYRVGFDVRFRVRETKERVVAYTIDTSEFETINE